MMDDTTSAAHDAVRDAMLRRTPAERVRDMLAFSERMRELSLRRLRVRHPEYTTLELVELLVGQSLVPRSTQAALTARRMIGVPERPPVTER